MKPTHSFVIVYGALRSGTTLLRLMLDGHSALHCPGEADFVFDVLSRDGTQWRYDRGSLENSRIYRANKDIVDIHGDTAERPGDLFSIKTKDDQTTVLMLHRNIDRVLDVFPDVPIIHLLRDPRDVARSSIGMGWAGDVFHGASHWLETENTWQAARPRMAQGQVMELKYEDLILEPAGNLQAICEFLNLPYETRMLEYDQTSTYGSPDPSLIYQWKTKLTPLQLQLVEGRVGPLIDRYGYPPSGETPRKPSAAELVGIRLANKRSIWTRKIARHGLVDPLIVGASRRLGLTAWGRAAQRRMDDRTIKFLK